MPVSALGCAAVVLAVAANEQTGAFKIRSAPTKGLYRHMAATPGARIALTGWNSYSRIDAVSGLDSLARLSIDSDAWTTLPATSTSKPGASAQTRVPTLNNPIAVVNAARVVVRCSTVLGTWVMASYRAAPESLSMFFAAMDGRG